MQLMSTDAKGILRLLTVGAVLRKSMAAKKERGRKTNAALISAKITGMIRIMAIAMNFFKLTRHLI